MGAGVLRAQQALGCRAKPSEYSPSGKCGTHMGEKMSWYMCVKAGSSCWTLLCTSTGGCLTTTLHPPLHQGGKSCPVPFCFILDSTSCLYRVDFNEMRERGFFHLSKISPLYREIHLFSVLTLPDILLVFSQSIKLNPPPYS